jgi:hypothetical protein
VGKKVNKEGRWSRKQLAAQILAQSAAHKKNKKVTVSKAPWDKQSERSEFTKVKKPLEE